MPFDIQDIVLNFFRENPDSSPADVINPLMKADVAIGGTAAALINVMRGDGELIVTGKDQRGVTLSLSGD